MLFDPATLLSAFVFGVIGFWLLKPAKERGNLHLLAIALSLMIYPYFIDGALLSWGIGIGLCVAAKYYW